MKKKNNMKKLTLKRETVAGLDTHNMEGAHGGVRTLVNKNTKYYPCFGYTWNDVCFTTPLCTEVCDSHAVTACW
ncbi:MAG: hypothetical protein GY765_13535 [bacterium]|nr:hypothetical protein [bacterium]